MRHLYKVFCISAQPNIEYFTSSDRSGQVYRSFKFRIHGYPKPNITWLKNGFALDVPTRGQHDPMMTYNMKSFNTSSNIIGCLNFKTATPRHKGRYTLIAENRYGRDNSSIFMTDMPGIMVHMHQACVGQR